MYILPQLHQEYTILIVDQASYYKLRILLKLFDSTQGALDTLMHGLKEEFLGETQLNMQWRVRLITRVCALLGRQMSRQYCKNTFCA